MAFDPETDYSDLLRTVVMLLRTTAIAASSRRGAHQIATAEEKINEALAQLAKIDSVKKLADAIQKNATKIDGECTGLNSGIRRLLDQALPPSPAPERPLRWYPRSTVRTAVPPDRRRRRPFRCSSSSQS